METDIKDIQFCVAQAKAEGRNKVRFLFIHGRYADNYNNDKQKLEQAIADLGYDFKWEEVYDNHGVAWATDLTFSVR